MPGLTRHSAPEVCAVLTGAGHQRLACIPVDGTGEEDALLGEEWTVNQASAKTKPKFPHHMIREIYEQPDAVRRVLKDHIDDHGTIRLPELPFTSDQIRSFSTRRTA